MSSALLDFASKSDYWLVFGAEAVDYLDISKKISGQRDDPQCPLPLGPMLC